MTTAADIELRDVVRTYAAAAPLRVRALSISTGDQIVIFGLDSAAAEAFVHLVTGAMLPESGEVRVAGRSTRDIPSDTDWLTSLDRFGLVTARAVLLDQLTTRANLALPLTLSIDPMPAPVRTEVDQLGDDVGLGRDRLDARVSDLAPGERVRLHLARALALRPRILLLEHPTVDVTEAAEAEALGSMVGRLAAARGFGWVALSDDQRFARSSGATLLRLDPASGRLSPLTSGGRGLLSRLFGRP